MEFSDMLPEIIGLSISFVLGLYRNKIFDTFTNFKDSQYKDAAKKKKQKNEIVFLLIIVFVIPVIEILTNDSLSASPIQMKIALSFTVFIEIILLIIFYRNGRVEEIIDDFENKLEMVRYNISDIEYMKLRRRWSKMNQKLDHEEIISDLEFYEMDESRLFTAIMDELESKRFYLEPDSTLQSFSLKTRIPEALITKVIINRKGKEFSDLVEELKKSS